MPAGLRDLGWIEGENLFIDYRYAENKEDRLPALAAEFVQAKVDLIVAITGPAALAAKDATREIPIVFAPVTDPVGLGLVASLARPGGNLTGLSFVGAEISRKWLEIAREIVPNASRVAVLWYSRNAGATYTLRQTEPIAKEMGIDLLVLEIREVADFERAFAEAARAGVGAVIEIALPLSSLERARVAPLATRYRLPTIWSVRSLADAGGLIAFAPNLASQYRRLATYVDRILRGAKPADLPVEQPDKFDFIVNLKAAETIGVTIPPAVLARATEVVR